MARSPILAPIGVILAALAAGIYQLELHRSIAYFTGIGHKFEPLSAYPNYKCRRIEHPRMRACEDMWLSEATRQLFLACSDPLTRNEWMPTMGKFNVTARSTQDAIVAMDIDDADLSTSVRVLATPDWTGIPNDQDRIYPLSLSGIDEADGSIRLWIVNSAPSIDHATGQLLDQHAVGGNLTVEVFRTDKGRATSLRHLQTFAHSKLSSPNRVAPVGDETNDFWYTNDHGAYKTGIKYELAGPFGWGDVSHCTSDNACRTIIPGHKFPNGLAYNRGPEGDGLLYVPSSLLGRVYAYKPVLSGDDGNGRRGDLQLVATIDAGFSLDNISPDARGDMYIAAFPKAVELIAAYPDPYGSSPATAAVRVRKGKKVSVDTATASAGEDDDARWTGFEVNKVIEDGAGGKAEILPGATTVVHDATTGRLFFSSVISPFIGVCEPVE